MKTGQADEGAAEECGGEPSKSSINFLRNIPIIDNSCQVEFFSGNEIFRLAAVCSTPGPVMMA